MTKMAEVLTTEDAKKLYQAFKEDKGSPTEEAPREKKVQISQEFVPETQGTEVVGYIVTKVPVLASWLKNPIRLKKKGTQEDIPQDFFGPGFESLGAMPFVYGDKVYTLAAGQRSFTLHRSDEARKADLAMTDALLKSKVSKGKAEVSALSDEDDEDEESPDTYIFSVTGKEVKDICGVTCQMTSKQVTELKEKKISELTPALATKVQELWQIVGGQGVEPKTFRAALKAL